MVFMACLLALGVCACNQVHSADMSTAKTVVEAPAGIDYGAEKALAIVVRDSLKTAYQKAGTEARAKVIAKAQKRFVDVVTAGLIPAWYGTAWDFNGVTQVPGEGKIACGYFLTTVLRDAGISLPRAKMAQQASLIIIRSLTPRETILDYSRITSAQFAEKVAAQPKGLYIAGLDIHTGFILHDTKGVWFIHSSYGDPAVVVKEVASKSDVLAQSKRFVLGRVDNAVLMEKWVTGTEVAISQ